MKKNQKGQALIEFVIVLPVLIMLIFSFVDLGRIVLENNRLESLTSIVINKYEESNDYNAVLNYIESLGYENVNLAIKTGDGFLTIEINKSIDLVTPGLNSILGDPYNISVERVVNYE